MKERPDLELYGNVGTLREFLPLRKPKDRYFHLVFSLGVCLDSTVLRKKNDGIGLKVKTGNEKELYHLKKKISEFDCMPASDNPYFSMELIISVCGYITDIECIDYLKSIDDTTLCNGQVHVVVCQRPNIGWLWGTLEDVWIKYRDTECIWYMADEVDFHFLEPYWFDKLLNYWHTLKDKKYGLIANFEKNPIDPYDYYGPLNKQTWIDKDRIPLDSPTTEDTRHVCPFYFMSKEFLEQMYDTYGGFTLALSNNFELDAIVYGEVGFCQRAKALEYNWGLYKNLTVNEENFE